ncbi:hypothetical protein WAF17_19260 [Bernardetia sp. ABR2-2B]|uniref:hypothetical protein n=1 Tax=Bernardetia sp. ABR2-2B TaxID=3127472 RepID=UPI0030CDA7CA
MKKLIFLVFLLIGFFSVAKADTLDYWHVYYNQVKVVELNTFSKEELTIKVSDKDKIDFLLDYLFIIYVNDTPCSNCEGFVFVDNTQGQTITTGKSKGTSTPIKIAFSSVVQYYQRTKNKYYDVFYIERGEYEKPDKVLLFRLKLE